MISFIVPVLNSGAKIPVSFGAGLNFHTNVTNANNSFFLSAHTEKTTPTTPNIFFSEKVLLKRKYGIIWKKKTTPTL